MIDLYTWSTPNGRKISIMLEETGLDYAVRPIDIQAGAQMAPDFLKISPNNKIPAIVDHDAAGGPLAIFESAAILTYLAEKTGQFLPPSGHERYQVLEWMAWQMAGVGPMLGQFAHFGRLPEHQSNPAALARFSQEAARLLRLLEKRLTETRHLAGEHYSIADIATYPWISVVLAIGSHMLPEDVRAQPATMKWLSSIAVRPAVQRGMAILA